MPDLLEQPPLNSNESPLFTVPTQRKRTLFTAETARLAGLKSALARSIKADAPLESPPSIAKSLPTEPPTDSYNAERITRVRGQLDKVDEMLMKAKDAQEIERLSRSAMSLSEQLRILLGQPLPGSRKPPAEKRERGPAAWESFTERPVAPPPLAVPKVCQSPASVSPGVTPLAQLSPSPVGVVEDGQKNTQNS